MIRCGQEIAAPLQAAVSTAPVGVPAPARAFLLLLMLLLLSAVHWCTRLIEVCLQSLNVNKKAVAGANAGAYTLCHKTSDKIFGNSKLLRCLPNCLEHSLQLPFFAPLHVFPNTAGCLRAHGLCSLPAILAYTRVALCGLRLSYLSRSKLLSLAYLYLNLDTPICTCYYSNKQIFLTKGISI